MKTKNPLAKQARKFLAGRRFGGGRGRTDHPREITNATPVRITAGDAPPRVEGLPHWKTQFRSGHGFSKTFYTPSTMQIVVGENWKPEAP